MGGDWTGRGYSGRGEEETREFFCFVLLFLFCRGDNGKKRGFDIL